MESGLVAAVAARSDTGRRREHNEDRCLVLDLRGGQIIENGESASLDLADSGVLLAVCDGMGGAVAGEVASAVSAEALAERAAHLPREELQDLPNLGAWLVEGVREANRRTLRRISSEPDLAGMGSTLTSVVLTDGAMVVAHVGDSRGYHVRDGQLRQFTVDQSFVGRLVALGRITKEEARTHDQRNLLLQAIGSDPEPEIDRVTVAIRGGDRILLCSDGLTDLVEDDEIREVLEGPGDPIDHCDTLVNLANARGGVDNITVVLAYVN